MKIFFSILSSFIFLFGAAGYYIVFNIADQDVKNEMSALLKSPVDNTRLIRLTFSEEEFSKEVRFTHADHREFIFQGEHYDVVERSQSGKNISFTCVSDQRETSLFSHLGNQVEEQSASGNPQGKISVKPIVQDWFHEVQHTTLFLKRTTAVSFSQVVFPCQNIFDILSPPPRA